MITVRVISNSPYMHSTLCTFTNCLVLLISPTSKEWINAAEAAIQERIIAQQLEVERQAMGREGVSLTKTIS